MRLEEAVTNGVRQERRDVGVKRANIAPRPPAPAREMSDAAPFALMALTRLGAKTSHGWLTQEVCHAGALRAAAHAVLCATATPHTPDTDANADGGSADGIESPETTTASATANRQWHAACSGAYAISYLTSSYDTKKEVWSNGPLYAGLLRLLTHPGCSRATDGQYEPRVLAALVGCCSLTLL